VDRDWGLRIEDRGSGSIRYPAAGGQSECGSKTSKMQNTSQWE